MKCNFISIYKPLAVIMIWLSAMRTDQLGARLSLSHKAPVPQAARNFWALPIL